MELERFPKAMPLREERDACRGGEDELSARGGPTLPVCSVVALCAMWTWARTRPPGRSGATSVTMVWLEGSLLLLLFAGRLLPALLDMSKVGLLAQMGLSVWLRSHIPLSPQAMFPYPSAHPGPETKRRWDPTYFCKSNLEFSSGSCPVTGCRKVFRLSLWLQDTTQWALLAPRKGEDGVQGCTETQRGAAHPPVRSRELHPSPLAPQIPLLLAPFCCSSTRALLCFLHRLHRLSPALPRLHSSRQEPE